MIFWTALCCSAWLNLRSLHRKFAAPASLQYFDLRRACTVTRGADCLQTGISSFPTLVSSIGNLYLL